MSRHSRKKPTQHDRVHRHAALDLLLPRLEAGRLTAEEAKLLAAYVREEVRLGTKARKSLTRTNRRLAEHREAADTAIREAEQRAAELEKRLTEAEAVRNQGRYRHVSAPAGVEQERLDARRGSARWMIAQPSLTVADGMKLREHFDAEAAERDGFRSMLWQVLGLLTPVYVNGKTAFFECRNPVKPDAVRYWEAALGLGDGQSRWAPPLADHAGLTNKMANEYGALARKLWAS
ncbi:hypothetical protein EV284_6411 [Streptomyces sp. BK022]|uniref:hypothetical protein n=1 Tax=Streptomyces sp. BK022 TaxID=2512123 RepID=UPI0010288634|nr:hypothetical protein [Streptomyces sp. BK022]RZU28245.1 hypothetical protein EV284_6411 [Streptomyces sp. BK022]